VGEWEEDLRNWNQDAAMGFDAWDCVELQY
jgi:hypothetical protein